MDTQIASDIIKIIGAIGVIASVLYLAIQIRHNTRSARSSTQQQLTDRIHERLLLVATHSNLAALIAADWNTAKFTDVESVQIRYWLAAIIADIKGIYAQYKLGLVTKSALHGRITIIKQGVFKTEIAVSTWNAVKGESEADFINWFEQHIINAK
jgi:hypothetical protein